jgi:HNH endonuclease
MPLAPGEVISYLQMCAEENASLQRGMNFKLRPSHSVVLMSARPGAPYKDVVIDDGKALIYEGHDVARTPGGPDPKKVDQPATSPFGTSTQNGLFFQAAQAAKGETALPELVKVYEKIRTGIWVYAGLFRLVDAWQEPVNDRKVFKFRLEVAEEALPASAPAVDLEHTRIIPTAVKLEVWKRDKGKCVKCGASANLHFDHDIPYSKGGSSLVAANIQLLCAKHNLAKHSHLE